MNNNETNKEVKFPFIIKDSNKWTPVYAGDLSVIQYCLGPKEALNYIKRLSNTEWIEFREVSYTIFWKKKRFNLWFAVWEFIWEHDLSWQIFSHIQSLVGKWIITDDFVFMFWKQFLSEYWYFEAKDSNWNRVGYFKYIKWESEVEIQNKVDLEDPGNFELEDQTYLENQNEYSEEEKLKDFVEWSKDEEDEFNVWMTTYNYVKPHLSIWEKAIWAKELQDKVYKILKSYSFKKDLLDGKVRISPLGGKYWDINLGKQYEVPNFSKLYQWPIIYNWSYIPHIRDKAFWMNEFRKRTGQVLQSWQYLLSIFMWRETYLSSARRAGKTMGIAEIINEEAYREKTEFENPGPIKIAYVWLSKKGNRRVIEYCKTFTEAFAKKWSVFFNVTEQQLTYYKYELVEWAGAKKHKTEAAIIDFIGAKDFFPGVGEWYDLIIIDEADKIPESVFDDYYSIVTNDWARLLCISTMNPNQEKTWFYDKLIEWERDEFERTAKWKDPLTMIDEMILKYDLNKYHTIEEMKDAWVDLFKIRKEMMWVRQKVWLRISWWEVDRFTKKQKVNAAKKLMEKNYHKYLAEWECVYPETKSVMDFDTCVVEKERFKFTKHDWFFITYDSAWEWTDNRALSFWIYDKVVWSPTEWAIIQIAEFQLEGKIEEQIGQVLSKIEFIIMTFGAPNARYFFFYDARGIWETQHVLMHQAWIKIHGRMKWVYWSLKTWNKKSKLQVEREKDNTFIFGKQWLVELSQELISNWMLKVSSECVTTLDEMKTYQKSTNNRWYTIYEAKKWKQDWFITGILYAAFFYTEKLNARWKSSKIMADRLLNSMYQQEEESWLSFLIKYRKQAEDITNKVRYKELMELRRMLHWY